MEQDKKLADPELIYRQTEDKQRVVVTGSQTQGITALVLYVLNRYDREFDYVTQTPLNGASSLKRITDNAPLIIIQEKEKPTASMLQYRHHIGVISEIGTADEGLINQFADATPKGGTLIFSETEPAQTIGKKERPGTTAIPYGENLHAVESGKTILISSHQERFPIKLIGQQNLRNLCAAKEVLKKVGITSEQFYEAISEFEG